MVFAHVVVLRLRNLADVLVHHIAWWVANGCSEVEQVVGRGWLLLWRRIRERIVGRWVKIETSELVGEVLFLLLLLLLLLLLSGRLVEAERIVLDGRCLSRLGLFFLDFFHLHHGRWLRSRRLCLTAWVHLHRVVGEAHVLAVFSLLLRGVFDDLASQVEEVCEVLGALVWLLLLLVAGVESVFAERIWLRVGVDHALDAEIKSVCVQAFQVLDLLCAGLHRRIVLEEAWHFGLVVAWRSSVHHGRRPHGLLSSKWVCSASVSWRSSLELVHAAKWIGLLLLRMWLLWPRSHHV